MRPLLRLSHSLNNKDTTSLEVEAAIHEVLGVEMIQNGREDSCCHPWKVTPGTRYIELPVSVCVCFERLLGEEK